MREEEEEPKQNDSKRVIFVQLKRSVERQEDTAQLYIYIYIYTTNYTLHPTPYTLNLPLAQTRRPLAASDIRRIVAQWLV